MRSAGKLPEPPRGFFQRNDAVLSVDQSAVLAILATDLQAPDRRNPHSHHPYEPHQRALYFPNRSRDMMPVVRRVHTSDVNSATMPDRSRHSKSVSCAIVSYQWRAIAYSSNASPVLAYLSLIAANKTRPGTENATVTEFVQQSPNQGFIAGILSISREMSRIPIRFSSKTAK